MQAEGGLSSPLRSLDRANAEVRRTISTSQDKDRMQSNEAHGDEHEKLRERIQNLEESLQRLGRESLERAKLGMEKLAEKYFPKVRTAGGPSPHLGLNVTSPGLVLPSGATAGAAQVRSAYPLAMPGVQPMPLNVTATAAPAAATTTMAGGSATI